MNEIFKKDWSKRFLQNENVELKEHLPNIKGNVTLVRNFGEYSSFSHSILQFSIILLKTLIAMWHGRSCAKIILVKISYLSALLCYDCRGISSWMWIAYCWLVLFSFTKISTCRFRRTGFVQLFMLWPLVMVNSFRLKGAFL